MDLNTLSENKNIFGTNQIRINGTSPTGTLKNPVNYILTLTKDVTFTDESGAEIATLPLTFTATFNYWMENNYCTELLNAEDIKQFWAEGFTIPGTGFGIEFEVAVGEKEYVPTETPDEEKPDDGTTEKPDEEKPDDGTTEKPDEEKPDDGTTEKPDEEKPDDGTTEKPDEEKPDDGTTEKPDEEKPDDGTTEKPDEEKPNDGKDDQGTAKTEPEKYEADGSLAIYAKKNLKGRDLKADEFQFKLEAVTKDAPMPKDVIAENESDGDIFFAAIAYDEEDIGKTYEYRMFELKGNLEKMTYDQSTYYFKVTVKDAGNGKLEIKQSYVPTFYNEYESKAAAKTGDTTMVPYYLATALFCGVVVIVAIKQMRRDDQA